MMRKGFTVALGVACLLMAGIASADYGTATMNSSFVAVSGTFDVDMSASVTTAGASTPGYYSGDRSVRYGAMYVSNGTTWTDYDYYLYRGTRTASNTSNSFPFSATLTGANTDTYTTIALFLGTNVFQCAVTPTYSYYCLWSADTRQYGTVLVDPFQPTPTINPNAGGSPVPTNSTAGLILLGCLLAAAGVFVLRRN